MSKREQSIPANSVEKNLFLKAFLRCLYMLFIHAERCIIIIFLL